MAIHADRQIGVCLAPWVTTAMGHLKEWVGIGALIGLMVLASLVCLWCICRMKVTQQSNAAMIIQAFMAIEAKQSPKAWLATLKKIDAGCEAEHCTWDPSHGLKKSKSDCMWVGVYLPPL